jgi:ParB family chromosome partitioning protein
VSTLEKQRRLEMALVENIQRENLNPIEEAHAYQKLVDEFGLKHDDIAAQVGKDRSSVANTLRLLRLPEEVRAEVASGRLSMGHARAIVSLATEADQRRVARDVLTRSLSVRETEAIVKKASTPATDKQVPARKKDVHTRAAEEQLRLSLGTPVEIKRRGKGGFVEIAFTSEDELQRIYEYLTERR